MTNKTLSIVSLAAFAVLAIGTSIVLGGSKGTTVNNITEVETNNIPDVLRATPEANKLKVRTIKTDEDSILYFNTEVTYQSVSIAINTLRKMQEDGKTEVYIVLDSPGGSVIDGAKLINYINFSKMKINTVCDGICASMAAQIHQVGKKRLMTPQSILMFHGASGGAMGTLEHMQSQIDSIIKYVNRLDAAVAKRVGLTYEAYKARVGANNIWIDSEDSLKQNFTDELVFLELPPSKGSSLDLGEMLKQVTPVAAPPRAIKELDMILGE